MSTPTPHLQRVIPAARSVGATVYKRNSSRNNSHYKSQGDLRDIAGERGSDWKQTQTQTIHKDTCLAPLDAKQGRAIKDHRGIGWIDRLMDWAHVLLGEIQCLLHLCLDHETISWEWWTKVPSVTARSLPSFHSFHPSSTSLPPFPCLKKKSCYCFSPGRPSGGNLVERLVAKSLMAWWCWS